MVFPEVLRSCNAFYTGSQHRKFYIRLVAIRSYWFFLTVPIRKVNDVHIKKLDQALLQLPQRTGFMLDENSDSVYVPASRTTYMHPSLLEGLIQAAR
jgi:hypothetical protein